MKRSIRIKFSVLSFTLGLFLVTTVLTNCKDQSVYAQDKVSKVQTNELIAKEIEATGLAVREAFKKGDLTTIGQYHHPEVVKALAYNNLRNGRAAVLEGINETMNNYEMEFLDDKKEELFLVLDSLVIKQALFSLKLIPKNGQEPFVFKGRTLLIMERHEDSPSGWVIRYEMIQPNQE